jgi:hypothetical protein
MENKFKSLGANLHTLNSDDMKQTIGGGGKRGTTTQQQSALLTSLRANYVPTPPPPGTVFIYGSYYYPDGTRYVNS